MKKKIKFLPAKLVAVVLPIILIVSVAVAANHDNIVKTFTASKPAFSKTPTLGNGEYAGDMGTISMQQDKDFKIITITDTHIDGRASADKCIEILTNLVKAHKPNLIVFTGDNLDYWSQAEYFGYNKNYDNPLSSDYGKLAMPGSVAAKLKEFYQLYGTQWCGIMGNHDRDIGSGTGLPGGAGTKSQNDFLVRLAENGSYGCLYSEGTSYKTNTDGYYDFKGNEQAFHKYGDYIVNVKDNDEVVYSLAFLDSGQHSAPGSDINGYLSQEQVDWYKSSMKAIAVAKYGEFSLEKGYFVPSIAFLHQPTPEFVFAAQLGAANAGGIGWIKPEYGFGYNGESPTTRIQREDVNYGFVAAMKEVGGTDISVGHNHDNNSTIWYNGVRLNYNNRTGRRSGEGGGWRDTRINYAKMFTISAGTYQADVTFAFPGAEDSHITSKILTQANVQR